VAASAINAPDQARLTAKGKETVARGRRTARTLAMGATAAAWPLQPRRWTEL